MEEKGLENLNTGTPEPVQPVLTLKQEDGNDIILEFDVTETSDLVNLIYAGLETYFSAMEDGAITAADALLLNKVLFALFPAFTGIGTVPSELMNLNDEEIVQLVGLADNFNLGEAKDKCKQAVKLLLTGIQTYSVFK